MKANARLTFHDFPLSNQLNDDIGKLIEEDVHHQHQQKGLFLRLFRTAKIANLLHTTLIEDDRDYNWQVNGEYIEYDKLSQFAKKNTNTNHFLSRSYWKIVSKIQKKLNTWTWSLVISKLIK